MSARENATHWSRRVERKAQEVEHDRGVRDDFIRAAYAEGVTIADLSRATRLTRTMLYRILDKEKP